MSTPISAFYPNRMGRNFLLAIEEVAGKDSLKAILELASLNNLIDNYPPMNDDRLFSFEIVGQVLSAMEENFGSRAGHGLALRCGRAFFAPILREFGPRLGLSNAEFRLQPLPQKLTGLLHGLGALFNEFTDQKISIEEADDSLLWRIEQCPYCWQQRGAEPVCHFAVGFLQEALYWISSGKTYHVVEETCIASGDISCTIAIYISPLV